LTRGKLLDALAAVERDGWSGQPMSPKKRVAIEKLLAKATLSVPIRTVRRLQVGALRPPAGPHLSPLAFADSSTLHVMTSRDTAQAIDLNGEPARLPGPKGLQSVSDSRATTQQAENAVLEKGVRGATWERMPPRTTTELGADANEPSAPPAWPLDVRASNGDTLVDVVLACDRPEVLLSTSSPRSPTQEFSPTRLLSPRPGSCSGSSTNSNWSAPIARGIGWSTAGPIVALAGAIIGPGSLEQLRQAPPKGSPLSRDGQWLVISMGRGLVLSESKGIELWSASPEHPELGNLTDCVVTNGATRVACLLSGRVVVVERAPR
jgi:hypothetical protein